MTRKLIAGAAALAAAVAVVPAHAASTKTVAVKNNAFAPATVSIEEGRTRSPGAGQGGVEPQRHARQGRRGLTHDEPKGYTFTKKFAGRGTFTYVHDPLVHEVHGEGQLGSVVTGAARLLDGGPVAVALDDRDRLGRVLVLADHRVVGVQGLLAR